MKNGQPLTLTDVKADTDTCLAKFVLTLAKGDQIALLVDELPVTFKTTGSDNLGEEYTVPHDGEYVFWVNEDYVWVDVPEVKVTYTIICNGVDLNLANVVPETWTDKAYFKVNLKAGDKIQIFADGEAVTAEYECPVDGEYTFGINAKGEFWKETPPVPIVKAEIAVDLGTWAAEGEVVFAHSWKDGSKLTEKVVAGKTNVIEGCDGFLLVVMPEGSEDIDWDKKVKQTDNLALGKGVLTYKEGNAFAWVSDDPEPETNVLTVEKNGTPIDQASEADTGTDVAVYKINLAIDDTLTIKRDGVALTVNGTEATEFTCTIAGEHTFYVNSSYEVWVDQPVVKTEVAVDLGAWAAEGQVVFVQSWKAGYNNYVEKVTDGKFNVIEGCKCFLLVVMPEGSESIDWDKKVKQTGDLTLGEGVLTYTGVGDAFEWVAEKEVLTATASYSGATTNLDGTNQAALLGLDSEAFSVVGEKLPKQQNNVGLNKDGTIRLYAKQCALILTGLTVDIQSIKIVYSGTIKATVSVGDTEIEEGDDSVYEVNAEAGTEIRLQFNGSSGQAKISSIEISYTE